MCGIAAISAAGVLVTLRCRVASTVFNRRRKRPTRVLFGVIVIAFLPSQIGYQDLGALLARQPGVADRWHEHLIDSPFGTIHAATFSMPTPIGTTIPNPPVYALANFDPLDIAGSIGAQTLGDGSSPLQFPHPNRKDKRDSLLSRARAPMPPLPPTLPVKETRADEAPKEEVANDRFDPYSQYEFTYLPDQAERTKPAASQPAESKSAVAKAGESKDDARIFFGARPLLVDHEAIKPYAPGEAPMEKLNGDDDIKMAALSPPQGDDGRGGESYANKGEVTGEGQRPKSPAERLGLTDKDRPKQEKCLADAVYFEARGEPVRGQIAVAQVVMNRVFSPFYPKTVCGVVYQNANRHLACQFTFACEGLPLVVTEPDAWLRAKRIAADMLDGKLWLPEVAKSTHYHAYWVHPDWVNEMRRIYRLGVHTFYRPRNWGDGSDEPTWGDPKTTAEETKILDKM